MSLVVNIKNFQALNCKGEKYAKIDFRGASHYSRVLEENGDLIAVDENFTWNLGRAVEDAETLQLAVITRGILRGEKIIAKYGLILQAVIREGRVLISDSLVDHGNRPLPAVVTFEVRYTPPDGSCSSYAGTEVMEDEQQMLIDIEQNIANLERSLEQANSEKRRGSWNTQDKTKRRVSGTVQRGSSLSTAERSPDQKRNSTLRSVRSLMRLGKQRPPRDKSCDSNSETRELLEQRDSSCASSTVVSRSNSVTSLDPSHSDNDSRVSANEERDLVTRPLKKMKPKSGETGQGVLKAQDYQVCVTVIEARQLAGLNMDPMVCVQVGDQRKYTSVKESTNCPYYNEYFVFDFHMPPIMLFDKIITLSVQQSRNLLRANLTLGSFKLDVATVWAQPDHQFYHKWALLTDPDDVAGGPKGYLKCDISVIGKGDSVKIPPKSEKDEDDIEGNLLLPDGVPIERQRARFVVKIYRADGLPKMNSSIMANVKKAFTGEAKDLVDPYVQVSFAGLRGETSVKRNSYAPVWNEQIVFTEMFPPLCQRMKIQLRDNDPVHATVIGTHFIDLKQVSNDGEKGFLPTFGPAFIHMYGSIRDYSLIDEHSNLNTGLGEGISYRGRLLIAIRTEISDNLDMAPSEVEVEPTVPITESSYARNEEFFLFASIMDATMIDKRLGDKPMYFEVSIGNAGNALDGHNESSKVCEISVQGGATGSGDEDEFQEVVTGSCQSTTPPCKPMTHDKVYYFLPYWDDKPCLHVRSVWPDYRRRMYNSNVIGKIADKLEEGLAEVSSHVEDTNSEKYLKTVLEELSSNCNRYVSISKSSATGPGVGKTKLDKERIKLCQREIESIGNISRNLKAVVTKSSFKERFKTAQSYLQKLKLLVEDPQDSLPDVFVWVISSGRRVAYHRIPGKDLIYSIVDEECGKYCGKVQTVFLKLPGKRRFGPSGWSIQTKLQIYMWLGILKHKKYLIQGIPKGYEVGHELRNIDRPRALPPSMIHYVKKHKFQLRAHMYQARSLIGSDASGLSDPFARVICGEFCRSTQVIDETLSPTWDELLLFDDILIYGTAEEIKNDPPSIVIELFDRDKVVGYLIIDSRSILTWGTLMIEQYLIDVDYAQGKSEYIGRAIARPHVKLASEAYVPPQFPPSLEWYEVTRGPARAGELLAVFELLEHPSSKDYGFPTLPDSKPKDPNEPLGIPSGQDLVGPILPVPIGIRPTLSKYRIEVLFWGLRDLKRVHLLTVDKPRVDVECAGHILYSSVISNAKKNPNFNTPIKFMELELPEQELYRPPLTIRAVDCRSFGRYTLVGTHTINSIHKYVYHPQTKRSVREIEDRKKSLHHLQSLENSRSRPRQTSLPESLTDVESNNGDTMIKLGFELCGNSTMTNRDKAERNSRRKRSLQGIEGSTGDLGALEDEEGCQDWWTKYFASVEAMIEENKETMRKEKSLVQNQQNDGVSIFLEEDSAIQGNLNLSTGDKSPGVHSAKKLFGLRSPGSTAKFSSRISPKHGSRNTIPRKTALLKIYPNELEAQHEYEYFKEWLHTFELYRGKKTGDEPEDESRIVGSFKGALKVYKWPLPKDLADHTVMGFDPQYGFFQGLPSNDPIHVLVRVYIVKANDLHPCDLNGKADPYVVLQLGGKRISDKDNYVSKQLNPVFGKCFEVEATFPQDSLLTVQVLDWDLVGADDLIGETKIDLENRFYSRHRATCGLARKYDDSGYNKWRDAMKPTQILSKLCKDGKVDGPSYTHGRVTIGRKNFVLSNEDMENYIHTKGMEEHLALAVLHQWNSFPRLGSTLVPEHVETRPLYNPDKPGIEQGKLEMWVDLFPMDMPLPGPPLDISPRKPKSYELRIIIWNTDDVVLEDDAFFTGEKMSDIYVKGWLKGQEDCQCTDIHYRSLTGEGNFNWRFIFPFDYLVAEEKIVINRKESLFSWDETECKIPARLELQVWDADHFSADDFLGAITLDLNRFPRGAKNSKLCTLGMLKTDGSVPMVNIFKQKRIKGWWPFYVKKENEDMELTGKVEAEIHLLTKEEAEKNPAGYGRNEPDPLDKPNRPDASFMWFLNPLKSIKYIVWHNYKWAILRGLVVIAVIILILLFFYAIPGYSVKKILGA